MGVSLTGQRVEVTHGHCEIKAEQRNCFLIDQSDLGITEVVINKGGRLVDGQSEERHDGNDPDTPQAGRPRPDGARHSTERGEPTESGEFVLDDLSAIVGVLARPSTVHWQTLKREGGKVRCKSRRCILVVGMAPWQYSHVQP